MRKMQSTLCKLNSDLFARSGDERGLLIFVGIVLDITPRAL